MKTLFLMGQNHQIPFWYSLLLAHSRFKKMVMSNLTIKMPGSVPGLIGKQQSRLWWLHDGAFASNFHSLAFPSLIATQLWHITKAQTDTSQIWKCSSILLDWQETLSNPHLTKSLVQSYTIIRMSLIPQDQAEDQDHGSKSHIAGPSFCPATLQGALCLCLRCCNDSQECSVYNRSLSLIPT